jgi:hypothetical protein
VTCHGAFDGDNQNAITVVEMNVFVQARNSHPKPLIHFFIYIRIREAMDRNDNGNPSFEQRRSIFLNSEHPFSSRIGVV